MNHSSTLTRISLRFTADFVFLIHFALVCIVSAGWLIPQLFYVHLVLLMGTLCSEIFLGYCPFTRLEFGIRKRLNPNLVFDKSCMMHYILKWRGREPRPVATDTSSFFKKHSFLFILLIIGIASVVYRFVL
jgi:hypothetical protein